MAPVCLPAYACVLSFFLLLLLSSPPLFFSDQGTQSVAVSRGVLHCMSCVCGRSARVLPRGWARASAFYRGQAAILSSPPAAALRVRAQSAKRQRVGVRGTLFFRLLFFFQFCSRAGSRTPARCAAVSPPLLRACAPFQRARSCFALGHFVACASVPLSDLSPLFLMTRSACRPGPLGGARDRERPTAPQWLINKFGSFKWCGRVGRGKKVL